MAKKRPVQCKCLQKVNKHLEKQGLELKTGVAMNSETGKWQEIGPYMVVARIDGKALRSSQHVPSVLGGYCPFCGKKIER